MTVDRVGSITIVRMNPRYDSMDEASLAQLESVLLGAVRSDSTPRIVLDFSAVEYFGSSLLEPAFRAWKECKPKNGQMVIAGAKGFSEEVLRTAQLHQLWPFFSDVDSAIAELSK